MIDVPATVKDALRAGDMPKVYRFNVLQDDGTIDFTIDNDTLIRESVKFDERMCSGDTLKFGLCEGASLEFQYFDHDNITGRRLQAFCDVKYKYTENTPIEVWEDYRTITAQTPDYFLPESGTYRIVVPPNVSASGVVIFWLLSEQPGDFFNFFPNLQNEQVSNGILASAGQRVQLDTSAASMEIKLQKLQEQYIPTEKTAWHTIPMGYFTVKKCSRQASTGIQKVTAYNKLQSDYLDINLSLAPIKIPSDYIDGAIAVYGLRRYLLSDYSIDVYDKSEATITVASESTSYLGAGFPSITFKFTGDSHNWYPKISSRALNWASVSNLSDVYLEVGKLREFTEVLESMVGYIYLYLATAGEVVDPTTFWDSFKAVLYKVAGVRVSFAGAGGPYFYTYDELYEWAIAAGATDVRPFSEMGNLYNVQGMQFLTPSYIEAIQVSSTQVTRPMVQPYMPPGLDNLASILQGQVFEVAYTDMETEDLFRIPCTDIQNVTLRQIMSSSYELNCKFGQMDRVTDLFYAAELNNAALYPADTLYPLNNLYPGGISETSFRSWYSKLWTDIVGEQSFRKLTLVYRALNSDNEPEDFTLDKIVNADGTTDYEVSDNWLLKNQIWTHQQVQAIADSMAERMENIRWFPFEMWAAGLPYVETGDMIEIIVGNETYTSYVLQRQLKGIQNLQDTYINGTLDVF